jgi:hypothetical protein
VLLELTDLAQDPRDEHDLEEPGTDGAELVDEVIGGIEDVEPSAIEICDVNPAITNEKKNATANAVLSPGSWSMSCGKAMNIRGMPSSTTRCTGVSLA